MLHTTETGTNYPFKEQMQNTSIISLCNKWSLHCTGDQNIPLSLRFELKITSSCQDYFFVGMNLCDHAKKLQNCENTICIVSCHFNLNQPEPRFLLTKIWLSWDNLLTLSKIVIPLVKNCIIMILIGWSLLSLFVTLLKIKLMIATF